MSYFGEAESVLFHGYEASDFFKDSHSLQLCFQNNFFKYILLCQPKSVFFSTILSNKYYDLESQIFLYELF